MRGRESLEDDPRSGRPSTATTQENIDCIHQMVMNDRRLTITHLANVISIQHFLQTSGKHSPQQTWHIKSFGSMGARLLTPDQKLTRLVMSELGKI